MRLRIGSTQKLLATGICSTPFRSVQIFSLPAARRPRRAAFGTPMPVYGPVHHRPERAARSAMGSGARAAPRKFHRVRSASS
jgi:hypothetical protein